MCAVGAKGTAKGAETKVPKKRFLQTIQSTNPNPRTQTGNAGSGLPLADVAWTQPLSTKEVARSAVKCCLEGTDSLGGGRGKDSGDAVVLKVQDIAEMAA